LGSAYYATHPLFPAEKTAGVINIDALCIEGIMKDVTVIGYGYSELDDIVLRASQYQDRVVTPDPTPEKGSYFRSDHFSFAKAGIPSVYIAKGADHIEHGREWTLEKRAAWGREHYHKPSDNYTPDLWDFDGMVKDVRLVFHAGYLLAMDDRFPNWREGTPFKALRDAMME
jgi:Zn-dependent M28 family amino/carboxypeptidase